MKSRRDFTDSRRHFARAGSAPKPNAWHRRLLFVGRFRLPVNEPPEPEGSQRAADRRAQKIRLRADVPQPRAEQGSARDGAVADEIVRAVGPRAQFRHGLADDECLARRFAELLQPAHDERQREPFEIVREQQGHGKQGEEPERDEHERTAAVFIRQMRDGDVTEHGRDHLAGDEPAELLCGDAVVVHRPQDDKRVRQPFAEADEDVADEQFAQRRREGFEDVNKRRRGRCF